MKKIYFMFYSLSVWFIGLGFYKMFCYKNHDGYLSNHNINAYVGGDGYNYIINSNYATSYFVLALIFVILGSVVLIIDKIDNLNINTSIEQNEMVVDEQNNNHSI